MGNQTEKYSMMACHGKHGLRNASSVMEAPDYKDLMSGETRWTL